MQDNENSGDSTGTDEVNVTESGTLFGFDVKSFLGTVGLMLAFWATFIFVLMYSAPF